jgi:hypothetical protein
MNLAKTITASLILSVAITLGAAGAAATQVEKKNTEKQRLKPGSGPCAVLNIGGTVYDASQCEELAATGRTILKNRAGAAISFVVVAGTTCEWQVVSKKERVPVGGLLIQVISKKDRSIVAKGTTDRRGILSLTIPSDLQGEFQVGPAPQSLQGGDDNVGFCFRLLPLTPYYLCPMKVVDEQWCPMRIVKVKP